MTDVTNHLNPLHLTALRSAAFEPQGLFGKAPAAWAATHGIPAQGLPLPTEVMTRQQVRALCQDTSKPVLHGYICAMAWGLQGVGKGAAHARAAWGCRAEIERRLTILRAGGLTRAQAYDLFAGDQIPGLGPSYFTKLVYYFRPGTADAYIMDQWTGKSVDLLTGQHIVRMTTNEKTGQAAPQAFNTGENYEAFCRVVDHLAETFGCTGDEMEQRLFCSGGQRRQARGAWRAYVHANWSAQRPAHRYDHAAMLEWIRVARLQGTSNS